LKAFIRPERLDDAAAISDVLKSAFSTDQEAQLVEQLRRHQRLLISLVAELDGVIAGHIAFSAVKIDGSKKNLAGLGLAPVAVRPALQRRGLGTQLIRGGLTACAGAGAGFVVVLGEPDYYRRFGFRSAGLFKLENEYGAGDAFMAFELKQGSITAGLVRYAPEFSALTSGN
jgi:putative acetyltransferase